MQQAEYRQHNEPFLTQNGALSMPPLPFRLMIALPCLAGIAPLSPAVAGGALAASPAQLIVRFAASDCSPARIERLARNSGIALTLVRPLSSGTCVLRPRRAMSASDFANLPKRLQDSDVDVRYVEPDVRGSAKANPVSSSGYPPLSGSAHQWYLDDAQIGLDVARAWRVTEGSANMTVAIIDSGILYDHPALRGRLRFGYDMIGEDDNYDFSAPGGKGDKCDRLPVKLGCPFIIAADGDGRDANASDPGDWIPDELFALAGVAPPPGGDSSSWHGLSIAGVIAGNGRGLSGIDRHARILPVRVSGRSYRLSDLIDSIRWSAGLPVPGIPANDTPAQIINMSLGLPREHAESCPLILQETIDAAIAHGKTRAIVVSAGNDGETDWMSAPASCNGVISVGSVERSGQPASYSNRGKRITLFAPVSNQMNRQDDFPVLSHCARTRPVTDASACPDPTAYGAPYGYRAGHGTSISAPMVSATVALMLAANPTLTPGGIDYVLRRSARRFPHGSTCNAVGAKCGAGIVNTGAAVELAARIPGGLRADLDWKPDPLPQR
jgi:serine protease